MINKANTRNYNSIFYLVTCTECKQDMLIFKHKVNQKTNETKCIICHKDIKLNLP